MRVALLRAPPPPRLVRPGPVEEPAEAEAAPSAPESQNDLGACMVAAAEQLQHIGYPKAPRSQVGV